MTKAVEDDDLDNWIDAKFGTRIREIIGDDWVYVDRTELGFTVDFAKEDDAEAYLRNFGGTNV